MKYIVRKEVVASILVEANNEDEALQKAAESDWQDWDQCTKSEDAEPEQSE